MHEYFNQRKTVLLRHTRDRLLRERKAADEILRLDPEDVDFLEPWLDWVLATDPRNLDFVEFRERFGLDRDVYRAALGHAIENIQPHLRAKLSEQNKARLIVRVALAYKAHFDAVPSADGVFGYFVEQLDKIIKSPLGSRRLIRSVLKPLR